MDHTHTCEDCDKEFTCPFTVVACAEPAQYLHDLTIYCEDCLTNN